MNPNVGPAKADKKEDWGWQATAAKVMDRMQVLLGSEKRSDVSFRVGPNDGTAVIIHAHK